MHVGLRDELFTPGGDEGECPVPPWVLGALRKTVGITRSEKSSEIEDSWKRPERAHRQLAEQWEGRTAFVVKPFARRYVERVGVGQGGTACSDAP